LGIFQIHIHAVHMPRSNGLLVLSPNWNLKIRHVKELPINTIMMNPVIWTKQNLLLFETSWSSRLKNQLVNQDWDVSFLDSI
jgi:hypothetical protein